VRARSVVTAGAAFRSPTLGPDPSASSARHLETRQAVVRWLIACRLRPTRLASAVPASGRTAAPCPRRARRCTLATRLDRFTPDFGVV